MNATDQLAETDRWLRYAEEDLTTAETLLRQPLAPEGRHVYSTPVNKYPKAPEGRYVSLTNQ